MSRLVDSVLVPVMGTIVGFGSPDPLPAAAVEEATRVLREADRVFSTWDPDSPVSRWRSGRVRLDQLDPDAADQIHEVLGRCALARHLTRGAFDPWAMPGGVDPTGLVKGWAAERALRTLERGGANNVIVNAGGDIVVAGTCAGSAWRVGVRHPFEHEALTAVVDVAAAIATSGDYERPEQLIDPASGRSSSAVASATVIGPHLDLADALATGLAVAGPSLLPAVDELPGYEAYLICKQRRHYATPGMTWATELAA